MCGITGLLNAPAGLDLAGITAAMTNAIASRGPDDMGFWADPTLALSLGHRRLSILELSAAGHQPMMSACGRYVLVFNGEIYNHAEIRHQLEAAGYPGGWRGHSDTETLLAGIARWGLAATLRRAVGMFALAVWDRQARILELARDRLGEKPLYYGYVEGTLLFASELKALRAYPLLRPTVDRDALARFLTLGYVPAPQSIYRDVWKVKPGTILAFSHDALSSPRTTCYWSLGEVAAAGQRSLIFDEAEGLHELERTLSDAIRSQSVADVPVGAFLSGGIDSSTIVALLQKQGSRPVQTFTIGFDELDFNEAAHAAAVARHLRTDHRALVVSPSDAYELVPSLPRIYDEPFADSSQIPTYFVSRAARSHVTVAISGDGGDELFGGYNRYVWGRRVWNHLRRVPLPVRQALGHAATAIPPRAWNMLGGLAPHRGRISHLGAKVHRLAGHLSSMHTAADFYRTTVTHWPDSGTIVLGTSQSLETAPTLPETPEDIREMEHRMMLWDSLTYLPDDILAKVDRAAMSMSLETRVPFLDHRVVELAWRLPLSMKIRGNEGKWALRQVLHRHVPRELVDRPKAGFAIPLGAWLRGPLRNWAEALLDERRLAMEGFFDPMPIRRAWTEHLSGARDLSGRLWCVLMFQAWLEEQL